MDLQWVLNVLQSCTLIVPLIVFTGSSGVLKGSATGRLDATGSFQFSSKKLGVKCDVDFEYVRSDGGE